MCGRTPRQMMLSQSLIDVKLSSHDLILKILANEKPEQLVAAFFFALPICRLHAFPLLRKEAAVSLPTGTSHLPPS